MLAQTIDYPIARLPISLKKHFSHTPSSDRIDPQVFPVALVVATGRI